MLGEESFIAEWKYVMSIWKPAEASLYTLRRNRSEWLEFSHKFLEQAQGSTKHILSMVNMPVYKNVWKNRHASILEALRSNIGWQSSSNQTTKTPGEGQLPLSKACTYRNLVAFSSA